MTTSLMPQPLMRFYTNAGLPAAGCKLYTYEAGTTTPKEAFTDPAGLVPHENPITLNANGEALVYWDGNYRLDLRTPLGAQIAGFPVDNFQTQNGQIEGLVLNLAGSNGATLIGRGTGTVNSALESLESTTARLLGVTPAERPSHPVFLEQHFSSFFGRGMLTSETINVTTEQALVGSFAAGAATLVMSNASQVAIGSTVTVKHDNGKYATYFVDSKSANNIGIRPGLRYSCATSAARIERTWYNRAHPGKFYMRELGQRIAHSTELDCSMPHGNRVLFTNFGTDSLTAVGGAAINYYNANNLGEGGGVTDPVRFGPGRTAFVDGITTAGKGAETAMFNVSGVAHGVAKVAFIAQGTGTTFRIEVVDENGREVGKYVIPAGADHRVMRIYTVPCAFGNATQVKVRVICDTYTVSAYFALGQIDVFDAPKSAGKIVGQRGAKIVCIGDSWTAGDMRNDIEREPITQQLALELPYATVINAGVGGNTIGNMLARFDTDVAPHNPDYVVIETGTNESYNPLSAVFEPNAINAFIDALRQMINKVVAIGARPIIVGVPALAQSDADVPAFAEWLLNDRAKAYAKAVFEHMGRQPVVTFEDTTVTSANGVAVKLADGTLICRHTVSVATTAALTLASVVWDFPVSFVAPPKVSTTLSNFSSNQVISTGLTGAATAAQATVGIVSGTAAFSGTVDVIAVGRWRT